MKHFQILALMLVSVATISPSPQVQAQQADAKGSSEQWKPNGKQILDFAENALKNNVDRTTIEQVLSDIASGKAVFLSEKEASKEKGLAKGQCVRMDCRGLPCAIAQGGQKKIGRGGGDRTITRC